MATWWKDGDVTGYVASVNATGPTHDFYKIGRFWAGPTDVGIPTRMQYHNIRPYPVVPGEPWLYPWFHIMANIEFSFDDLGVLVNSGGNYSHLGVTAFFVPATAPVYTSGILDPSKVISVVRSNAGVGFAKRSPNIITFDDDSPLPWPGNAFHIYDVSPADFSGFPDQKWWVVVTPTKHRSYYPTNNPRNDALLRSPHAPNSSAVSGTRSFSFYTNRKPEAPTILGLTSGRIRTAGEYSDIGFTATDPDLDSASARSDAVQDRAGVEFQYAAVSTSGTPHWMPLPIVEGGQTKPGWYIAGSTGGSASLQAALSILPPQEGIIRLHYGEIASPAGTVASNALLPGGEWQIRMRVFDWGHPYPSKGAPGGAWVPQLIEGATPYAYPASNTSPWSEPITVSVEVQVPPPIPLSPINNNAVIEGKSLTFRWQYRNTSVAQHAQASRVIEIRKVGDPNWTQVVSGPSVGEFSYTIPEDEVGFLVSGNQYEWRVKVTDSTEYESEFSQPATFWVVPEPGQGGDMPVPAETDEQATLGCGTHRVFVYRRGGRQLVGELTNLTSVDWARKRDDISTAKVVLAGVLDSCGALLAKLQTLAYEIVIIRDNGFSQDRVWEGPITLISYEREKVTIQARDVMFHAYRRIIKDTMSDTREGDNVVSRAVRILQTTLAPDDPNVLTHLNPITSGEVPMQYRHTPAYARTAFEEIDDMASNAGLDYTVVGRSIILWGTRNPLGKLPEFRDENLGASPIVTEYGMSFSNYYAVSDGNGLWGSATRLEGADELGQGGEDPTYGIVEMLSSSWASDSAEDTTYTEAGRLKIIESFKSFSERSIEDRFPPPVQVRVPDNTSLNPNTVISIQHLVPGVAIPLRSSGTIRQVRSTQKLDSVRVIEEGGKETITISLSPFNRQDDDLSEGGEEV